VTIRLPPVKSEVDHATSPSFLSSTSFTRRMRFITSQFANPIATAQTHQDSYAITLSLS
jgi:hypothetical protein